MTWLDGFEHMPIEGHTGGTYTGDHPWRVVLHSTEGSTIEGAVSAYKGAGVPPHFTIDPRAGRKSQHIDTDSSAYAVMNQPGGVETNRWRAIQIEIVMMAVAANTLTVAELAFIAEVLTAIRADKPFDLLAPAFVAYPSSYGFGASQRMTFDEWAAFSGVCGHQHVPENDHGDPGAIDITRIFASVNGDPAPTPKPHEEDDMPKQRAVLDTLGRQWNFTIGTDNIMRYHVIGEPDPVELPGTWKSISDVLCTAANDDHGQPLALLDVHGIGTDDNAWQLHDDGHAWTGPFRL